MLQLDTRAIREAGNGTDAAAAIQLALATMGKDAMHRLLLIWDGNQTTGDLEAADRAAVGQHVPIDVMPLRLRRAERGDGRPLRRARRGSARTSRSRIDVILQLHQRAAPSPASSRSCTRASRWTWTPPRRSSKPAGW